MINRLECTILVGMCLHFKMASSVQSEHMLSWVAVAALWKYFV